MGCLL